MSPAGPHGDLARKGAIASKRGVPPSQGGEPAPLGHEFIEKVVALQRKHAKVGQRIENDLQTDGTLLTDDWARFLKQNRFLVGLSIDGPRDSHDHYRIAKHAEPTFERVFAAAQTLQNYVYPEYRLGNIRERSLGEMVFDPPQVKFLRSRRSGGH